MPLLSLLAFVTASYQGLESPLVFTERAAPVGRVLAKISELTKVRLEAAPNIAGEIVAIKSNGLTGTELMERIAKVTTCEWKKEGEGYRLIANLGARNAELAAEQNQKLADFRANIAEQLKQIETDKKTDKAQPSGMAMAMGVSFMLGRSDESILRLINAIDYRGIAQLESGDRIVFSSQPTRMQRPLGPNVKEVVAELTRQQNELAKASANSEPAADAQMDALPEALRNQIQMTTKPVGTVAKALLVASRTGFGLISGTQIELVLFSPDGKVALKRTSMIGSSSASLMNLMNPKPAPPTSGPATPFKPSEETEEFKKAMSGSGRDFGKVLDKKVKDLLLRPDLKDPLSFMETDVLFAIADKRKTSVVACIPDSMLASSVLNFSLPQSGALSSVEGYESKLKEDKEIAEETDAKSWLVKPAKAASSRKHRLDRTALATLIQAAQAKGLASLDDVAAFAIRADNPTFGGLAQPYVSLMATGTIGIMEATNWEALRIYGLLDPTVRANLANGSRLPLSSLPPGVSQQVNRVVYGAGGALQVEDKNKPEDPLGFAMMSGMALFGGNGGGADYRTEPTELLPNGLPANGYLTLTGKAEPIAMPIGEGDQPVAGAFGLLDLNMLALLKMFKEEDKSGQIGNMTPKLDRVRVGQRTAWTLKVQLAEKVSATAVLNDNRIDKNGTITTETNLPADFQKQIADRLAAIKKSPMGAMMSMGMNMSRGATPPPLN